MIRPFDRPRNVPINKVGPMKLPSAAKAISDWLRYGAPSDASGWWRPRRWCAVAIRINDMRIGVPKAQPGSSVAALTSANDLHRHHPEQRNQLIVCPFPACQQPMAPNQVCSDSTIRTDITTTAKRMMSALPETSAG